MIVVLDVLAVSGRFFLRADSTVAVIARDEDGLCYLPVQVSKHQQQVLLYLYF